MMLIIIVILPLVMSQTQMTLTQPPYIETNSVILRLINNNGPNITNTSSTITYIQQYNRVPAVHLSLTSMYNFPNSSTVSFIQTANNITLTYFDIAYSLSCIQAGINCSITRIDINYLVFDYLLYYYVTLYDFTFTVNPSLLTNQFYSMTYMERLNWPNFSFALNCYISGFQSLQTTAIASLYVDALFFDSTTYLLNVKYNGTNTIKVHIVRIVVITTIIDQQSTTLGGLGCLLGTIYHYSDPNAIENNVQPDYLPFAMFYGVKGWVGTNITAAQFNYIFENTNPRVTVNIGYLLFITKSCPANQLYVAVQALCYNLSSAFYYQATSVTLLPCPTTCYQCTGPLSTQCKSCIQGWNRVLSMGMCVCISGFYDPGARQCKNCTLAISGCKTCNSATNCLTCLPGCTVINFNPIYCDCPNMVQTNFSYSCNSSYYYQFDTNTCNCLPQTYYDLDSGLCFPCDIGCFLCVLNSSYCLLCIDSYTLVGVSCIYFYTSYALLGTTTTFNSPQLRCMRFDPTGTICIQKCKAYYYEQNCYASCPVGTFKILFPWLTCQPCKLDCLYCFNFTICYQCQPTYYFFNTSILTCSPCPANCIKCINTTFCTSCSQYYVLQSQIGENSCELPALPPVSCSSNCSFCVISQQCAICKIPFYLNSSSHICIDCNYQLGLQLWADGCHEICGDGTLINNECDDGNTQSGDGCSSVCQIEYNFQCSRIGKRSYCWTKSAQLQWSFYPIFGNNQIELVLFSPSLNINNNFLELSCNFKNNIVLQINTSNFYRVYLQYKESIIFYQDSSVNTTLQYYSGNSINLCQLTVNKIQTYNIYINTYPQSLMVDYSQSLQSINSGTTMRKLEIISIYVIGLVMVLGLAPMASFSCLRVFALMIVSYMDYLQVPINAFGPNSSLVQLLFVSPFVSTENFVIFSSQWSVEVLWHILVLYVFVGVLLQLFWPFIIKVSRSMDWNLMSKLLKFTTQTKPFQYQIIYTSYETIIWCIIIRVFANFPSSSTTLIALVFMHFILIIATKVHFFFTYQKLQKLNPDFSHVFMIEQLHNFTIAIVIQFSTTRATFMPIVMMLYAGYVLLAVGRNNLNSLQRKQLNLSNKISIWQHRVITACFVLIQLLKLANMWKGLQGIAAKSYEQFGVALGLAIGLLTSMSIILGGVVNVVGAILKIHQIRNFDKIVIPSNNEHLEQISIDLASNVQ